MPINERFKKYPKRKQCWLRRLHNCFLKDDVIAVPAAENWVWVHVNQFLLTQTEHPSPHPKRSPNFRGAGWDPGRPGGLFSAEASDLRQRGGGCCAVTAVLITSNLAEWFIMCSDDKCYCKRTVQKRYACCLSEKEEGEQKSWGEDCIAASGSWCPAKCLS